MVKTILGLCVSAFLCAAAACSGGSTTTSPSPLPKSTSTPSVGQTFHLTGIVIDDAGNRVPTASFSVASCADPRGCYFVRAMGTSDTAGLFRVDFTGAPDGINGCAAFAWADKAGYDLDARYLCPTTLDFSQSFRLHRPRQIAAGESTAVTVAPDDSLCYSNYFDEPEAFRTPWVCRAVHITVVADGILTAEVLNFPVVAGGLDVELPNASYCCETRRSIPVTAGTDVLAAIMMDSRSTTSQSFTLSTSLARQ